MKTNCATYHVKAASIGCTDAGMALATLVAQPNKAGMEQYRAKCLILLLHSYGNPPLRRALYENREKKKKRGPSNGRVFC